jgi:hypothetical protein
MAGNEISNFEVTPQAVWLFANSLTESGRPKAPTAIHGLSGLKFLPIEKDNAIADWKIGSHYTTCVTNAMKNGWKLMSIHCLKPRTTD